MPKKGKGDHARVAATAGIAAGLSPRVTAEDLEPILEKLKLLEFGLYGVQESARLAPLDVDDLGPFVRLAEEIGSDVEALRARLASPLKTAHQD
jgi:hypothetical protein